MTEKLLIVMLNLKSEKSGKIWASMWEKGTYHIGD